MENTTANQIQFESTRKKEQIKQRRITVYSLYCEGRRTDEITNIMDISSKTIQRDLKWCRKHLKREFTNEILEDIIFDTYRRRVGIWTKIKEQSRTNTPVNHIIFMSKHLLELDKKIIDWLQNAKFLQPDIDQENLDDLLNGIDKHLKGLSDEDLKRIILDPEGSLPHDNVPDSSSNSDDKNGKTTLM
ncbi:hypothetical protein KKB18_06225 [bacterium]|nr:hypothetical protein [bacterium]